MNDCFICKDSLSIKLLILDRKDYYDYYCMFCKVSTKYCFSCNRAIDVLLDSRAFKCFICKTLVTVTNRDTKYANKMEDNTLQQIIPNNMNGFPKQFIFPNSLQPINPLNNSSFSSMNFSNNSNSNFFPKLQNNFQNNQQNNNSIQIKTSTNDPGNIIYNSNSNSLKFYYEDKEMGKDQNNPLNL
jgi:hypothetical protein